MTSGEMVVAAVLAGGVIAAFPLGIYYPYDRRVAFPTAALGALTASLAFLAAFASNAAHCWLVLLLLLPFLFIPIASLGRMIFTLLFYAGWLPRYEKMPPGPYCKKCGYSPHGLPDLRCAECGEVFDRQRGGNPGTD